MITGVDTSSFAKKTDSAHLKSDVDKSDNVELKNIPSILNNSKSKLDKLDIGKLEKTSVDLSKLSNVIKNDAAKKDIYNAKIKNIEDKISDIANLATEASLNAKINEVKGEIPNITNVASTTAFTTVENKIPNVSNLVKKTDYKTNNKIEKKITDHNHDKYISTPQFNKLIAETFAALLSQRNLASKSDVANFVKKTDFDDKLNNLNNKITSNKTKYVLVEKEFKKLQTFDSSLFIGQTYFNNDGSQNYLIFQPIYKTITAFSGLPDIMPKWKSKGLSNEKFMPSFTSNNSLSPKLVWMNNSRIRLEFIGGCLKEDKAPFKPNNVVNLYIVYELNIWS